MRDLDRSSERILGLEVGDRSRFTAAPLICSTPSMTWMRSPGRPMTRLM
jgi:hypothetical protein